MRYQRPAISGHLEVMQDFFSYLQLGPDVADEAVTPSLEKSCLVP
jgi:hypothetical protein